LSNPIVARWYGICARLFEADPRFKEGLDELSREQLQELAGKINESLRRRFNHIYETFTSQKLLKTEQSQNYGEHTVRKSKLERRYSIFFRQDTVNVSKSFTTSFN
jgi:hypothetical protein